MYKKVKKSFENPYGIEKVVDEINEFISPSVLCMVPQGGITKLNGYLSKISVLLGLRHDLSLNSGYDVSQVPFSLLVNEGNEKIQDNLLYFIPENDKDHAKKIIRNLNIVSYCNGHDDTLKLINDLHDGLIQKGYSEEDVEEILSQMFVLQVVDNLFQDGQFIKFPYVTSITFHNIHDEENRFWLNNKSSLFDSNCLFSRISTKLDSNNNLTIVYDSFGEGSLSQTGEDHSFSRDYCNAPVLNTLMSVVLINALYCSFFKEQFSLDFLQQHFSIILEHAHEYEEKNKPLDEFTKEDLDNFNEYMYNFIVEYMRNKFSLDENATKEIELDNERINAIKQFLRISNGRSFYPFDSDINKLMNQIEEIIFYYNNYEKREKITIEQKISNMGMRLFPYVVEDLIRRRIHELLEKLKNLVNALQSLKLPDTSSIQLKTELERYKSDLLKKLLNPTILKIMQEYGFEIIDIQDEFKL